MILKLNCGIKQLKTERDKLKTESYGKDNIKKTLTDAAARRDGNRVANTIDQKLFVIKTIKPLKTLNRFLLLEEKYGKISDWEQCKIKIR